MDRFLKIRRLEDSEILRYMIRHDHNALVLLMVVAARARRKAEPHPVTGRRQFEAELGDFEVYGMSERGYRTAKQHLEKWGLVTIKTTSKGTIATLLNKDVYDINPEAGDGQSDRQTTDSRRSSDDQATTKKNEKNVECKNGKNKSSTYTASTDAGSAGKVVGGDSYCGLKGERLNRFEQFWESFNYKRGKVDAAKAWKKLEPVADDLFQKILAGAKQAAAGRVALVERGQTPKMAQGWLSGRRWEDEPSNYSNENGGRRYDAKGNSRQVSRKVDSVGRASGSGLPEL